MPLSYGDEKYRDWLRKQINDNDVVQLFDFMPKNEYFEIVNNCSYALFGSIRQQAIGNINYAIKKVQHLLQEKQEKDIFLEDLL